MIGAKLSAGTVMTKYGSRLLKELSLIFMQKYLDMG